MKGLKALKVLLLSFILGFSVHAVAVVDINSANVEELQQLKGIGPKKASDIVAYREVHGAYKSVDELLNVSGIGKATLEKLRDELVVSGNHEKVKDSKKGKEAEQVAKEQGKKSEEPQTKGSGAEAGKEAMTGKSDGKGTASSSGKEEKVKKKDASKNKE